MAKATAVIALFTGLYPNNLRLQVYALESLRAPRRGGCPAYVQKTLISDTNLSGAMSNLSGTIRLGAWRIAP
jgi:hypothetical protein